MKQESQHNLLVTLIVFVTLLTGVRVLYHRHLDLLDVGIAACVALLTWITLWLIERYL